MSRPFSFASSLSLVTLEDRCNPSTFRSDFAPVQPPPLAHVHDAYLKLETVVGDSTNSTGTGGSQTSGLAYATLTVGGTSTRDGVLVGNDSATRTGWTGNITLGTDGAIGHSGGQGAGKVAMNDFI